MGNKREERNVNASTCHFCGAPLADKGDFCNGCGRKIEEQKVGPAGFFNRNLFILLSLVVICGVGYVLLTARPERPDAGFQHPDMSGMNEMNDRVPDETYDNLPDDFDELVAMGNINMDQGRYQVAVACYRRALEIDSSSADVHTDLGACLHAVGNWREALQVLKAAIALDPNHTIAHFNLGVVYSSLNDFENTRTHWNKYIELAPESPIADTLRAYMEQW